jgi:hypothetical protein
MKRTPSSSKKKSSDSASVSSASEGALGEIRLGVLFQSRLGAAPGSIACPPSAIHMNAGDMKRIGIMNGTLVRVYIESSSTHLALFAFAALRGGGQPGSAVLSRVWSGNFKGEDRNVTISRDYSRYSCGELYTLCAWRISGHLNFILLHRTKMVPCDSICMRVLDGNLDINNTSLFTTYFKSTLSETTLAVGNIVLLPWKLGNVSLRVRD